MSETEPVTTDAGRELTLLRAAVLVTIGIASGTVAHTAAGGRTPDLAWFAVIWAVGTAIALPLLRRPQTLGRIAVLAVAAQTLVHLVLTAASGHGGDPVGSGGGAGAWHNEAGYGMPQVAAPDGHTDHTHVTTGVAGQLVAVLPRPLARIAGELTLDHLPMMAAHLGAATLLGLWLGWAEQSLWRLLAMTPRPLLRLFWPVTVSLPAEQRLVVHHEPRRPVLTELRSTIGRRGPPPLLAR